jgi:hypothetical protein
MTATDPDRRTRSGDGKTQAKGSSTSAAFCNSPLYRYCTRNDQLDGVRLWKLAGIRCYRPRCSKGSSDDHDNIAARAIETVRRPARSDLIIPLIWSRSLWLRAFPSSWCSTASISASVKPVPRRSTPSWKNTKVLILAGVARHRSRAAFGLEAAPIRSSRCVFTETRLHSRRDMNSDEGCDPVPSLSIDLQATQRDLSTRLASR